jgi:hypothetical protein
MTTPTRSIAVGVFNERDDAERGIEALRRNGFTDDQIGFAARDPSDREGTVGSSEMSGDAGEGAATGALTGGVLGSLLGAFAAGLIPGVGPVLAGGLLAGILGGAVAGAAAGGLIGALADMGLPEEEARYYNTEFEGGRTLVTVKTEGRYDEARRILEEHGAYDVERRGSSATARRSHTDTAPDSGYRS